jgi:hypothetical protein
MRVGTIQGCCVRASVTSIENPASNFDDARCPLRNVPSSAYVLLLFLSTKTMISHPRSVLGQHEYDIRLAEGFFPEPDR